ncbi:MAG: EamA family transporter [Thermoanaerobaculia bacterium]|nr:EamA family transporter [Thermoanaerobaculia bacterium]
MQSQHSSSLSSARTALRPTVLLAFAAIYLIWGSTYLVIRFAIETIPPFLMAGMRFLVAGVLLYAVLRWSGVARPTWAQWRSAAFLGVLMMCGGNGLVTWSEQTVPSALAALMVTTVPLWMVALDALFYGGPKPGARVVVGLGLGLLGVLVLVGPSEGTVHPTGAAVLLLATFLWAQGSLRGRSAKLPRSPWMTAALQMVGGGLVLLLMATLFGEWQRFDPAAVSARSLWAVAYLVIAGSIVALSAYVYLLRETAAASVSTYAFVNPVIALFLGWLVGEPLNVRSFLGAALVISAVILIHWAKTSAAKRGSSRGDSSEPSAEDTVRVRELAPAACPSDR